MRRTVEANDRHAVLHAAYQSVENCAEVGIISDMACAGAANFDADCQGQRLRIRIRVERESLRNTVVREREVTASEAKEDGSLPGLDQSGDQDDVGTNGHGRLIGSGLLSACFQNREREQETYGACRSHT